MSINIDTNKITKFGKSLPTPYIDSVEIYDDYITLKCSLYFQKPLATNEQAYQQYVDKTLNNINICATILPRGEAYEVDRLTEENKESLKFYKKFIINEKFDPPTAMLLNKVTPIDFLRLENEMVLPDAPFLDKEGHYEFPLFPMSKDRFYSFSVQGTDSENEYADRHQLIFLFPKDEPEDVTKTLLYDSVGNPVERVMLERNIYHGQKNEDYKIGIYEGAIKIYQTDEGAQALEGVDLFLFTTSLNSNSLQIEQGQYSVHETEFNYSYDNFSNEALTPLYNSQISDVTYEQISANGVFKTANVIVYKAPDNTIYIGPTPIQAIDSLYYGASSITLPAIVEQLRGIMGTSSDKTVQDAYDNINYILETAGQQSNLLIKLNQYRKTFPETSTAVPAGKFYEVFERTLYNINNEVKRNLLLAKVINSNPIVKDYRSPAVLDLDPFTNPVNKTPETDIKKYIYLNVNADGKLLTQNTGYEGVYCAYGDPNSVAETAPETEANMAKIKEYSYFKDAQNEADVGKKLRALANTLQDDLINLGAAVIERLGDSVHQAGKQVNLVREFGQFKSERLDVPFLDVDGDGVVDAEDLRSSIPSRLGSAVDASSGADTIFTCKEKYFRDSAHNITQVFESFGLSRVASIAAFDTEAGPRTGFGNYVERLPDDFKTDKKRIFRFDFASDPDLSFIDYQSSGVTMGARDPAIRWEWGVGVVIDWEPGSEASYNETKYIGVNSSHVNEIVDLYNEFITNLNVFTWVTALYDKINYTYIQSLNHYLFGYWFFDYERSIRNNTTISKVYSVDKLENTFGRFFVQDKYSFKNTKIKRYAFTLDYVERNSLPVAAGGEGEKNFDKPSTYDPIVGGAESYKLAGTMTSNYSGDDNRNAFRIDHDISTQEQFLPSVMYVDQENITIDPYSAQLAGVDIAQNSSKEYTYCILRPFITPGDKDTNMTDWVTPENRTLNGYRLACFEHQEVFQTSEKTSTIDGFWSDMYRSFYTYQVTLTDNTAKIYYELVSYFKNLFEGQFTSYYQAAFDQCSYDNVNERFNDFFITGILETFGTQIATAPWYLMPVVYHVHRDLIYNEYKGDKDLIFAAAHRDTQNIAPETGNLASLELFRNSVQQFYNKLYGDGGTLHQRVVQDLGLDATSTGPAALLDEIRMGSGFKEITYGNLNPDGIPGEVKSTWYGIPPIINLANAQGLIDDLDSIEDIDEAKSSKAFDRAMTRRGAIRSAKNSKAAASQVSESKSTKAVSRVSESKSAKAALANLDPDDLPQLS